MSVRDRLDGLSEVEQRALLAELLRARAARPRIAPVTSGQRRLWFVCQLDPEAGAYNVPAAVRLTGVLDVAALAASFAEVVRRHESLRTTFSVRDGQPVQVVAPTGRAGLPVIDMSGLPESAAEKARLALEAAAQPFDLTTGPLLRLRLLRLGEREHVLLVTLHHLVADGWSIGVLVGEIAALYRAFVMGKPSPLPELPIQYADFALWQRDWLASSAMTRQLAYWREHLAGLPAALDLPADRPRPSRQSFRGALHLMALPARLSAALVELGRREGASLFMTLLGGFYTLLWRYTGRPDLPVGSPIANRNRSETEGLIGLFANTVVLRGRVVPGASFQDLLAGIRGLTLAAYNHQDLPFERLVEELRPERDLSRSPLFQVMFVLQNAPMPAIELPALTLSASDVDRRAARFDLLLSLQESPQGLRGWLEHSTDLFDPPTAARMARHLESLLAGVVADPSRPLDGLPLLAEGERRQLLAEWNDTAAGYPGGLCLHQLFETQAERTPEAVAVRGEGETLTYRDFEERTNRLAHHLRACGVGPEGVVGVLLERSVDMVVALYAILKAGGAYLPLDPSYPRERLTLILAEAAPPLVITRAELAERLPEGMGTVLLDLDGPRIAQRSAGRPASGVQPGNLAYVIYTSGSTGRPKGTMNAHRGIVNRILWMQEAYGLDASDAVLQKTPFGFDVSVWEFFWPLATGARLVVAPPDAHRDPAQLVDLVAREGITTLHFVPSLLRAFVAEPDLERCTRLRRVVASGEALPADLRALFCERLTADLHNLYGPTEAAVDVTAWACRREWSRSTVPIGRPIANLRIHLLDAAGQPVPVGVAGELHIGGIGVGRGYLARPDLTAERFVPDPFGDFWREPGARLYRTGDLARYLPDGEIDFLGRLDHQVKIRGFRIELQEIEAALAAHPSVAEAAVAVHEDEGHRRLVGYVVSREEAAPEPASAELRRFLAERLPEPMVPAVFVFLAALPLGATGKLDRRALPAPARTAGTGLVLPRTPLEELLANVWAQVLRLDRVSIHDNFFALGGDSIRSIQVRTAVAAQGWTFALQDLFQHQTVAELARRLVPLAEGEAEREPVAPFGLLTADDRRLLPEDVEDAYPLAALQAGMLFHTQLAAGTALYHDVFSYHLRAPFDAEALAASLRRSTARHPTLRTSLDLVHFSEPLQLVHRDREVELPLVVEDLRALDEAGQRAVIDGWIAAEKRISFDWSRPPLLRFRVHRRSDETFQFSFSFHHTILDGWSLASLLTEVFRRYLAILGRPAAEVPEEPPPLRYHDFVALEREALASAATERYWLDLLAGSSVTPLPRWPAVAPGEERAQDPERPVGALEVPVPAAVSEGVQALARRLGVPVRCALLAAHVRVVGLLSGQSDLVTGLVGNSRPEGPGGEQVLGLFLNTLPFRIRLREGTWADLVRAVFETERGLFPHRRYPMGVLQRKRGGEPLFETAFNFVHYHVYQGILEHGEVEALEVEIVEETNLPLMAYFNLNPATAEIRLVLKYDTALLALAQVEMAAGWYARALAALAERPDESYGLGSPLGEAERHQLLVEWNDTAAPSLTAGLPQQVAEWAARTPDAVAAVAGGDVLTYAGLAARMEAEAGRLAGLGVARGEVVPLLAERGLDLLVSILGTFAVGAAYLPLDPHHPLRRTRDYVERSGARLVLAAEGLLPALAAALEEIPAARRPRVEPLAAPSSFPARAPEPPEGLAYVIYTSGSTGAPKGAMVEQSGMLNHLSAKIADLGLGASDAVAQTASQCFDISVWQFLVPLAVGGRVHVFADEIAHDPARLLAETEAAGISVLETVPSLLAALIEAAARQGAARPPLARLRWLMATGEALPPELCRRWLALYPGIPLVNAFGPTECSDDVTHHRIASPPGEQVVLTPIGRPVANTRLYVLDAALGPLPAGVAGELYAGGAGVGRGYLGDGPRTAEVFVPDPFGGEPGARLYRTGDLARRHPDGTLEFLGRIDHQVKIRGFRIELAEIEAGLGAHPDVREAVVLAVEEPGGGRRLAAYVAAQEGAAVTVAGLRSFLGERLPDYMVPGAFAVLPEFPLTANGKVDRRALPELEATVPTGRPPRVAPRTPVEELLALAWAEVLRLEEVSVLDDFFALGGHSLLATQLVSRVRLALGVDLPLRELFEAPTVAALAARVEALRGAAPAAPLAPVRRAPAGPVPLSFPQERLWFLDQLEPGSAAYNLPTVVRIRGELDPAVLARCFSEIVRRHESLRTTFTEVQGQGRQVIHPPAPLPLLRIDLTDVPEAAREEAARRLAREEIRRPFDLAAGPLVRTALLRLHPDEHVLVLTVHHIVSDGWSQGVLIQELAALYPAFAASRPSPLEDLPLQYRDFALWQREQLAGEALAGQLAYWREQLKDAPQVLELPGRRPLRALPAGATRWLRLPGSVSRGLRNLGRREGATLFMTLLAGFMALLHRYTGQDDLVLGTPVANRSRPEIEGLIGFFVNTLVLRSDLSGAPPFRELLARVREAALGAYAHPDLPFERLVAELNPGRDLGRSPLFQAMFVFHNAPVQRLELPGLSFELMEVDSGAARFELMLTLIEEGDGVSGSLQWRTDLFETPTALRLVEHLGNLLAGAVAEPGARLRDLPLLGEAERQQLAVEWNDRRAGYPDGQAFHQLFEEQAARTPEAVAALCSGESWTYRELDQRADRLARILAREGVGPETLVALAAERGLGFLAAILAVWKAGGAYLPLDPRHPAERHRQILAEARPALLLHARSLSAPLSQALALLPAEARPPAFLLEDLAAAPVPETGLPCATPDHLAYVIFTSGSTGVPKGAMVIQRGMVNHLWTKVADLGLTADDAVAQNASQCFDISVWQMLAPLAVGGRVVIYPDETAQDPARLLQEVERGRVSVLEVVPSLLRAVLGLPARSRPGLAALRWMIATGEALPADLVREWGRSYPRVPLLNAYGPTECSDDVTHHPLPAGALEEALHVPIGRPVANTRLYLLDPALRPVAIGVTGQLWVGGEGVGRGYLGDPWRTARAFLPDLLAVRPGERMYGTGDLCRLLPEGTLEFLGRIDNQVKVRGFRIELGEIEAVLAGCPDLSEAVVMARREGAGGYRLAAFVVPAPGRQAEVSGLRKFVRQHLPEHMAPASFVVLDRLPLTANGKLDREALATVDDQPAPAEEYVPPGNEVEETLAEVFASVIGAPRVGVYDNFFDLGGHSLLATQVVSRVRETFEVELTLRTLFEAPTVAELAAEVERLIIEQIEALGDSDGDCGGDESYPVLEAQRDPLPDLQRERGMQ